MSDACDLDMNKDCPYSTKIALIEKQLESLTEEQSREENFRKTYYNDREARGMRDATLDAKITSIDEKLDRLLKWQSEQQAKPVKRWDGIVDRALWAVLAAVIAFLLAKVGL